MTVAFFCLACGVVLLVVPTLWSIASSLETLKRGALAWAFRQDRLDEEAAEMRRRVEGEQ